MAAAMGCRPVHIVFDSIVAPYPGETVSNLRKVLEFVGTGRYVALFGEFDIVVKRRGGTARTSTARSGGLSTILC